MCTSLNKIQYYNKLSFQVSIYIYFLTKLTAECDVCELWIISQKREIIVWGAREGNNSTSECNEIPILKLFLQRLFILNLNYLINFFSILSTRGGKAPWLEIFQYQYIKNNNKTLGYS